jgi:uncharacterized protein
VYLSNFMEQSLNESHILAQTYEEVKKRFSNLKDLAHGWEHVSRVYKLAEHIAEQEGADRFIVGMAALMHDLGRTTPHDAREHHADLSVKQARQLMAEYQVPEEKQEAILHAIIAHSFSRRFEPRTLEARIVRDADRIDGLGALGILRWAITGSVRHAPHTYHRDDPFGEQRPLDDHTYMLDHFYVKLLKLSETMTTATGRQIAQQRTAFMRTYLDELRRELAE